MIDKADKGNPNSKCIRGVISKGQFCLLSGLPVTVLMGQIYIQTRQVSIPTADALAVLGHAADAIGVKN